MILLPYFGFLLVDIKHKKFNKEYPDFLFNSEETEKYAHFRETFGHEVWYAVSDTESDFKEWLWIPSLHVMKDRKVKKMKDGEFCYVVPKTDFIKTNSFQDLLNVLFSS